MLKSALWRYRGDRNSDSAYRCPSSRGPFDFEPRKHVRECLDKGELLLFLNKNGSL